MRRLVYMVHIFVLSASLVFWVMQASVKAAHGLKLLNWLMAMIQ